jgi:hypothetical protein
METKSEGKNKNFMVKGGTFNYSLSSVYIIEVSSKN